MWVYKITNLINGKVYIGQTRGSVDRRFKRHCTASPGKRFAIWHAITKHGQNNFKVETIDSASTLEELNDKERYWIKYYDSTDRNRGYNLNEGGGAGALPSAETRKKIGDAHRGRKRPPFSKDTRMKISLAAKGRKASSETKTKMSATRKGRSRPEIKGKKRSEEAKKAISKSLKGKKRPPHVIEAVKRAHKGAKRSEVTKTKLKEVWKNKKARVEAGKEEFNVAFGISILVEDKTTGEVVTYKSMLKCCKHTGLTRHELYGILKNGKTHPKYYIKYEDPSYSGENYFEHKRQKEHGQGKATNTP